MPWWMLATIACAGAPERTALPTIDPERAAAEDGAASSTAPERRPKARVALAALDVSGPDRTASDAARHEVRRRFRQLAGCAEPTPSGWPVGRVDVVIALSPDAEPVATVDADTTDARDLAACVAARAAAWPWPRGATGRIALAVTFDAPATTADPPER